MRRKPLARLLAVVVVVYGALLASGTAVGGETDSSATAVVRLVLNKQLKRAIVVDASGRALYMFTADRGGTSTCTPERDSLCARAWPPLVSDGAPIAGQGLKAGLLATTPLADGRQQVMYNRHPLYYFRGVPGLIVGDRKPGHVRGQGPEARWWVLSPEGRPIRTTT